LPQSDYFSIGAILYEVVTGRAPGTPFKLPSEVSPVFGIEADELILKALAVNPQDRFGSSLGFIGALESLRSDLLRRRPDLQWANAPSVASPLSPSNPATANSRVSSLVQGLNPLETTSVPVAKSSFAQGPTAQGLGQSQQAVTLAESLETPKTPNWSQPQLDLVSTGESVPTTDLSRTTHAESPSGELPTLSAPESFEDAVHKSSGPVRAAGVSSPWSKIRQPQGHVTSVLPNSEGPLAHPKLLDNDWLASDPTPLWVWVALIIMGIALTFIAAWLGFQSPP